jgi:exonuclease VII large subunit
MGVSSGKIELSTGKRLTSAGFESVLARGYSIVRDADGAVIGTRAGVTPGPETRCQVPATAGAAATGGQGRDHENKKDRTWCCPRTS